jgi:cholesterol transport system auxiliary component
MIKLRSFTRLAVAGALAMASLGLSACVTLLPQAEPVTLYRFEAPTTAPPETSRPPYNLLRTPVSMPRAAGADRILTVTGTQVAYVAGARWVSPAATLFDEAVARAFQDVQNSRAAARGDLGRPDFVLRLDVTSFETRYSAPGAVPTVYVRLNALLQRSSDRSVVASEHFEASIPAGENRVSAIVTAYDQASSQVIGEMVAWVGRTAR